MFEDENSYDKKRERQIRRSGRMGRYVKWMDLGIVIPGWKMSFAISIGRRVLGVCETKQKVWKCHPGSYGSRMGRDMQSLRLVGSLAFLNSEAGNHWICSEHFVFWNLWCHLTFSCKELWSSAEHRPSQGQDYSRDTSKGIQAMANGILRSIRYNSLAKDLYVMPYT